MPAPTIAADYDRLAGVADRLAQHAEATAHLVSCVTRHVHELQAGAWIGEGAKQFFAEMDDDVLPAVARLRDSLCDAYSATLGIIDLLHAAEDDAAHLFHPEPGR